VWSAVGEDRVCYSCATCTSHTISHGTIKSNIHLRLVQEIRAERVHLQRQESWSVLCDWCNCGPCSGLLPTQSTKSTRRASRELQLPQTTVPKILRKRLLMKPYKLQLFQALKPEDLAVRYEFCREILARIGNDDLPARFIFSDEATFHINGKVNRHYVRVWGTENSHFTLEHERDHQKWTCFVPFQRRSFMAPSFS
jgi:hypothetical protein